MIVFPHNSLALVSMLLTLYFLQGCFFFLFFHFKVNRFLPYSSREHLYFSAMSLGQALYSLAAWQIYSSPSIEASAFWQKAQWFAGILLFMAFVLFSLEYLDLKMKWMKWLVLIPGFFFAAGSLGSSSFLQGPPSLKVFSLFGNAYKIYELDMGWPAKIASLWISAFMLPLLFVWFFHLTQRRDQLRAAALGIICLILAGFNEIFVSLRYYTSPYVLEYGFFLFSLSFYYQLFGDFFDLYRENITRSKKLEELNEEARFFINTVAHDLRAPLLSIEGFASLVEEEAQGLGAEQRDYIQRIQRNVLHMSTLLNELKEFIQIGAFQEKKERFALEEVVNEVLSSFEPRLKNFEVRREFEPRLPLAHFSRRRVVNILTNLIDNAIKYSEGGQSLFVEVSAKRVNGKIQVSLRDRGPGIPLEHQDRVFQAFYRIDPRKPGSGIGLAAVKKMLNGAGERIWLESEPGQGCAFHFTLPVVTS